MIREPVPGWPGVYVQEITAAGALALQEVAADSLRGSIRLARLCARQEDGSPLWATDEAAGDAPMRQIRAIAEAVLRISGLDDTVEAAAGN